MMSNHIDDFMRRVFNRRYQSVWVAFLGRNQSGKTDMALYTMEKLHELGLADGFGSNIPDLKAPFDIDFIEDYPTLKERCYMLNPSPSKRGLKRYFFLADEMGDWAPKDQPWLNVKFIKELQQVRKYGLSFLGCAIDRVDDRILNDKHFHGYFVKSKRNPKRAAYYDWMTMNKTQINGIPRTKIEFDTFYSASFFMDRQNAALNTKFMNPEHEMIVKYFEAGKSWDKTEFKRWEGKRAIDKVLKHHLDHCLQFLPEESKESEDSTTSDEVLEKSC